MMSLKIFIKIFKNLKIKLKIKKLKNSPQNKVLKI